MWKNFKSLNLILDEQDNWVDFSGFLLNFKTVVPSRLSDEIMLGDEISGTDGDDIIQGTSIRDIIYALGGDDTIYGNGGNDAVFGGDGNDFIDTNGSWGNFNGEDGNDTLTALSNPIYTGSTSHRVASLYGGDGDDSLTGSDNNDSLFGDNGIDMLTGGLGNDILHGGFGADSLYAGGGRDKLYFDENDVIVDGGDDTDNAYYSGSLGVGDVFYLKPLLPLLVSIERIYLGDASNRFDFVDLSLSPELHIYGGDSRDVFSGTHFTDNLFGEGGNDVIEGRKGDDFIRGGDGSDQLYGNLGVDVIYGDDGVDYLYGGNDNDRLFGGDSSDRLFGGNHDDYLDGGNGNDILRGEAGADSYFGGNGKDRIFADSDDVYASGGDGLDRLEFTTTEGVNIEAKFIETVLLTDNDDYVDAAVSLSSFYGQYPMDGIYIYARDGNDTIISGDTHDHIYAGKGDDTLTTGNGVDMMYFVGRWGHDIVTDFQNGLDIFNISGASVSDISQLTISQVGNDTLVEGFLKSILILNTDASLINSSDFIFTGYNEIIGTSAAETLQGLNTNDVIFGGSGYSSVHDYIYGNGGHDILIGASVEGVEFGRNTIYGGWGDDVLIGSLREDFLFGGNGNDTLRGGEGRNEMDGGKGDDVLYGTGSYDVLRGGLGADMLFGGRHGILYADDDDLYLSGNRIIVEDSSFNHTFIDAHVSFLQATDGNDYINTQASGMIAGYRTYLTIKGNDGDDTILTGISNDHIYGGRGNDVLTTDSGEDTFFFFNSWGDDIITDYDDATDLFNMRGTNLADFNSLSISQDGADALIQSAQGSIRLLNTDIAIIDEMDFLF